MRAFFGSAFSQNPWQLTVLLACIAVFIAVLAWQLAPSKEQERDQASRLPLND